MILVTKKVSSNKLLELEGFFPLVMPIGTLLQVAMLAVLSSLIVRKLGCGIPPRAHPLVPVVFAVVIYWVFVAEAGTSAVTIAGRGFISGLLACGALYVLLGVAGRLSSE